MGKESITIVLDSTKFMFNILDDDKTCLRSALEIILLLFRNQLLYKGKSVEISLLTYNDGDVNEELDYAKPNLEDVRSLKTLEKNLTKNKPKDQTGDLFFSIALAMNKIEKKFKKRKVEHRIFLLSSLRGKTTYSKRDVNVLANTLDDENVRVNIITFGDDDNDNDPNYVNNQILLNELTENCKAEVFTLDQAYEIFKQLSTKSTSLRSKFTGLLEISPTLSIDVVGYSKALNSVVKSLKKFSLASDPENMTLIAGKIATERFSFAYDDPNMDRVDEEYHIRGYEYGDAVVPMPNEIAEQCKIKDEQRCLKILGFTESQKVPRHHFLEGVDMFIPQPDNNNIKSFNTIVKSLMESEKIGIARYTTRRNSAPKLVALIPDYEEDIETYVIYIAPIPTAEDLREYNFTSLEPANEEQEEVVDRLIDDMEMIDEDGEELLILEETFNPVIQQIDNNLVHRAFNPDDKTLQPMDPVLEEILHPERITVQKAREVIKKIKEVFNLEEKEEVLEKKSRIYWKKIANKNAELQNSENANAQMVNEKGKPDYDDNYVTEISRVHPISDFKEMLGNKKVDLTDKAFKQMKDLIEKLVTESMKESHMQKAYECIVVLRKGCIDEEEPGFFNSMLVEMKSQFNNPRNVRFLEILVNKGTSLISDIEDRTSDVSPDGADEFLQDLERAVKGRMNIENEEKDAADDDLLDDLE